MAPQKHSGNYSGLLMGLFCNKTSVIWKQVPGIHRVYNWAQPYGTPAHGAETPARGSAYMTYTECTTKSNYFHRFALGPVRPLVSLDLNLQYFDILKNNLDD